jgi:Protein of unknown function (DUF616)
MSRRGWSRAAIVTAIYDDYDPLKPICPQSGVDVEWVVVTDSSDLAYRAENELGWTAVVEPRPDIHPNRAAKHPKFLPWEYVDANRSIWVDASFRVTSPSFAADVLERVGNGPGEQPVAQFGHPWRSCIYQEGLASVGLAKYATEPILAQTAAYRAEGFPTNWGLWATGVIARVHTPRVSRLGEMWLKEVYSWSFQDQLSEPVCLWRCGLRPAPLPGTHIANPWLSYEISGRH